jgi:hypothetical protein
MGTAFARAMARFARGFESKRGGNSEVLKLVT